MSIEQAIHRHWSSCAALSALVPVERLFTGQAAPQTAWPYVTLERSGAASGEQTSSGTRIEAVPLRCNVWDQRLDRAQRVADELIAALNRRALDCDDTQVLDFRLARVSQEQPADGIWRLGVEFLARVAATSSALQ